MSSGQEGTQLQENSDTFERNVDSLANQERAKDFKGSTKRLIGYLAEWKIRMILICVISVCSVLFTIVAPKILAEVIDYLSEEIVFSINNMTDISINFEYMLRIVLILLVLYVGSSIFMFLQRYMMASVTQKVILKLREQVGEKLSKLPLEYYDSHSNGDLLSRVSNDINVVSMVLKQNITAFISAIVTSVGIIMMMISIHPLMTLIPIISSFITFVFVVIIISKTNQYFVGEREILGEINGHMEECYKGHNIIKAFCREKNVISKFDKFNEKLYDISWKAQFYPGLLVPGIYFFLHLSYALICIIGGISTINGTLSVGKIVAFLEYSKDFFDPTLEMVDSSSAFQACVAAAERVFEILDEQEEVPDRNNPKTIKAPCGKVEFENVKFAYKDEINVIDDMSITVFPGETVAIVGPTGAGKTTLVNLLMRFYDIQSGKISIDGVDIRDLKRESLQELFGMVLQDAYLLNGTMRENIAYGKDGASNEDVIRAAKIAHIHHFIMTLPEGYDTMLSEEDNNISQGQKQLITIARAVLKNPYILILDEATSNVDTRTEVNIQKAIDSLMKGRTSFIIAHRLSTIRYADLILVMENGKIIEKGNHETLMKNQGFYSELYNNSFGETIDENIIIDKKSSESRVVIL